MVAFAKCIRAHGISNLPAPTFNSAALAPGAAGASVPLPANVQSPGFQRAVNARPPNDRER